jgi:predicted phage baseplate assembly protein
MNLPAPNLDDRSFQDLVDEAKRLVQLRCPEWTDNNVADPGVTLIESFAFMVDQLIYRLNRVPDLNYIKFLDLLGEQLRPPSAAIAPVRFSLAVPKATNVLIPAGTLVSTARRGQDPPISFSTQSNLDLVSVSLEHILTQAAGQEAVAQGESIAEHSEFSCFSDLPQVGDALYVGLTQAAPSCIIRISVDCRIEGIGVDPLRPPLIAEGWDGQQWTKVELLKDTTGGLNQRGTIDLYIEQHALSTFSGLSAGWIRVRVVDAVDDQPRYTSSPQIRTIDIATIAGITNVSQCTPITNEIVGTVTGTPGEILQLNRFPLVSGQETLAIEVSGPEGWTVWSRVESFAESVSTDLCFTVDDIKGQLRFGPMIRNADGSARYYGANPTSGSTVRVPRYLVGGGIQGNVERGAITVMRTNIPSVAKVESIEAAIGGVDPESIESLKDRAALTVRSRNRAVTALDFEQLVRAASRGIVRTKCVDATDLGKPGTILILVIPQVPEGAFSFEALQPPIEVLNELKAYLDLRRLIGTTIRIEPPKYIGVSAMVRLAVKDSSNSARVTADANAAISNFLNPVSGGYDGAGWPFGRTLVVGDVYGILQNVPGVAYTDLIRLVAVDPVTGDRGEPGDRIQPGSLQLLFNMDNQIEVIE